ncbi:MAG: hypothetical protein AAF533_10030 [Acidobacteriota bacterium]
MSSKRASVEKKGRARVKEQQLSRRRDGLSGDLMVTVVASISIALPLLFYLNQHSQLLTHGYAMEELEQVRSELRKSRRDLLVERARLSELSRIERAASEQGLTRPAAVLRLNETEAGSEAVPGRETNEQMTTPRRVAALSEARGAPFTREGG